MAIKEAMVPCCFDLVAKAFVMSSSGHPGFACLFSRNLPTGATTSAAILFLSTTPHDGAPEQRLFHIGTPAKGS